MIIGFTGHRDCHTTDAELDTIATRYPGVWWVHGGAQGFDTQVDEYAKRHNLPMPIVKRPQYDKYPPKLAPIMRNYVIVDMCDFLVACYDGRKTGGTRQTIEYAELKRKPVILVACLKRGTS